jgi:hypothetical protein
VVTKAEHIDGKSNPRFVVTSLPTERWAKRALYEDLYLREGTWRIESKSSSCCSPIG